MNAFTELPSRVSDRLELLYKASNWLFALITVKQAALTVFKYLSLANLTC